MSRLHLAPVWFGGRPRTQLARSLRRGSGSIAMLSLGLACDAPPCDDRCGLGTQCVEGKCIVQDAPASDGTSAPEEPVPTRAGKKGKRRRGAARAEDASAVDAPVYDDSAIPRYDPQREQTIGEGAGSERPSDRTIRQHLDRIEPAIERCIEEVVAAGVDVGSGQVSFEIGIEPSGKVWGITATAPAALKSSGVVACMRKKIHAHRFPSWDGPAMGVDYSFEVR